MAKKPDWIDPYKHKRTSSINPPGQRTQWHIINPLHRPVETQAEHDPTRRLYTLDKDIEIGNIKRTLQRNDLSDEQRTRLQEWLQELEQSEQD